MNTLTKAIVSLAASVLFAWSSSPWPAAANPVAGNVSRPAVLEHSRPTIALALGGGGVRGAAHIGVLRQFEKEGIPIDYIAGSSMGAVIGGMYAAGVPLDALEQMFTSGALFKAFTPVPVTWKVMTVPPRAVLRSAKRVLGLNVSPIGLYPTNKLADFVNSHVTPGQQHIERTTIPFAAVATNLLDGKTYALQTGNLGIAVQASSAIPFYIRPIAFEGKLLVDGALRDNVPTLQARQSKTDIVISVNVNEEMEFIDRKTLSSFRGYSNRIMSMMLSEMADHQVELADIEIRPETTGLNLYSRSRSDAVRAIRAGEKAASAALPKIKDMMDTLLAAPSGVRLVHGELTVQPDADFTF